MAGRVASGQVLNVIAKQRAVADRGLGGSGAVDQHPPDLRRRAGFHRRGLRRPQFPLRYPRARHGRHSQRHVPGQGPALWLRLPDLQRLRPAGDPARRPDGDAGDLYFHPRFDRRGRGRADPPAGRAVGFATRHPGPGGAPSGRRQRSGRGLARHHAISPSAGRAGVDPAKCADPGSSPLRTRLPVSPGAGTCWPMPGTASPTCC